MRIYRAYWAVSLPNEAVLRGADDVEALTSDHAARRVRLRVHRQYCVEYPLDVVTIGRVEEVVFN